MSVWDKVFDKLVTVLTISIALAGAFLFSEPHVSHWWFVLGLLYGAIPLAAVNTLFQLSEEDGYYRYDYSNYSARPDRGFAKSVIYWVKEIASPFLWAIFLQFWPIVVAVAFWLWYVAPYLSRMMRWGHNKKAASHL